MYEVIAGVLFVAISMIILVGGPKNINKSAEELSVYEFERNKSLWIAMLCPAVGIFIVVRILVNWNALYDREPVFHSLFLGAAAIIYGGYRWIKLFRTK